MKKLVLIMLVLVPLVMQAQIDTLEFGDRDPTYYYWGEEWIDAVSKNTGVDYTLWNLIAFNSMDHYSEEIARCCYTKDTLKVIGVAVVAEQCDSFITINDNFEYPLDTTRLPEYCHIFKYNGPTEEETPMLAEARWENTEVRYMFYSGTWFGHFPVYCPLHEAYFDSAIYVCDTFYVSATAYSNYKIKTDSVAYYYTNPDDTDDTMYTYSWGYAHPPAQIYGCLYYAIEDFDTLVPPPFGYPLIKYGIKPRWYETNRWYKIDAQDHGSYMYVLMFPIFDTSSWHDTTSLWCTAPNNLRAPMPDAESTVLLWNSTNGTEWDVSLCKECTEPDSGVITHYTTTFANLTGLEAGATYRAWVRAYCNESDTSYWSEGLQFTVPTPADTGGTEQLFNVDDTYFVLTPNPACGMVNAFSSFQIRELDIYTMSGTLVRHESPRALSVNVDVSDLPKGLYIVRATTAHGMAYARLVKL